MTHTHVHCLMEGAHSVLELMARAGQSERHQYLGPVATFGFLVSRVPCPREEDFGLPRARFSRGECFELLSACHPSLESEDAFCAGGVPTR